jgi:hypothetical protein
VSRKPAFQPARLFFQALYACEGTLFATGGMGLALNQAN